MLDCWKGIIEGIPSVICKFAERNDKYISDYDESNESTFVPYFEFNNIYDGLYHRNLILVNMNYVEDISMCTANFIINYDENSNFGYALLDDIDYPELILII